MRLIKYNKNKRNKKTRKGGGIGTSKPKRSPPKSEKSVKKTKKRVSFAEKNEIREQSPRSDDAFYYPAKVNHEAKNTSTRKEKLKKQSTRRRAITSYQNRRAQEDLLDMMLGKIPLDK
jgi:hypothetical protein